MEKQQSMPKEVGSSWEVKNISYSGLRPVMMIPGGDSVFLYVREQNLELWNLLQEHETNKIEGSFRSLFITGDPGSGKSTALFGWTAFHASEGKSVVWVTQRPSARYFVTDFQGPKEEIFEKQLQAVKEYVLERKPTIVVLDGIRAGEANSHETYAWADVLVDVLPAGATLIFSSSLQSSRTKLDLVPRFIVHHHFVTAWSDKQLADLRKHGKLNNIKYLPQEVTDSQDAFYKHKYYAGSSVRLMGYTTKVAKEALDEALKVTPFSILQAARHQASLPGFANMLFKHNTPDDIAFVSSYVAHVVESLVTVEMIEQARQLDRNNNAYQGWLLEIEVRVLFRSTHTKEKPLYLKRFPSLPFKVNLWRYEVNTIQDYCEVYFQLDKPIDTGQTVLFIPDKTNQACFDFVVVTRLVTNNSYKVDFLQATEATCHDLLLFYAAKFLQQLFPHKLTTTIQTRSAPNKRARVPTYPPPDTPPAPTGKSVLGKAALFNPLHSRAPIAADADAGGGKMSPEELDAYKAEQSGGGQTFAQCQSSTCAATAQATPKTVDVSRLNLELLNEGGNMEIDLASPTVERQIVEAAHDQDTAISVHVYFALGKRNRTLFDLRKCVVHDVLSVQQFDPDFNIATKIRTAYVTDNMDG